MNPMKITILVELLLRRPGTVIDRKAIARALRNIGLDTRADIIDVRVVLGTLDQVVASAVARERSASADTRVRVLQRSASVLGDRPELMVAEG